MSVPPLELAFRRDLKQIMDGKWLLTWHEDKGISPGVPDLHYIFPPDDDGEYELGWLELKASRLSPFKIKVEPSQHQYIRRWLPHIHIHFLIRVQNYVYLVDAKEHDYLPGCRRASDMMALSSYGIRIDDLADQLPVALKNITRKTSK